MTTATCRLPSCRQPILAWLDRQYCSVDHRNRATRAKTTIAANARIMGYDLGNGVKA